MESSSDSGSTTNDVNDLQSVASQDNSNAQKLESKHIQNAQESTSQEIDNQPSVNGNDIDNKKKEWLLTAFYAILFALMLVIIPGILLWPDPESPLQSSSSSTPYIQTTTVTTTKSSASTTTMKPYSCTPNTTTYDGENRTTYLIEGPIAGTNTNGEVFCDADLYQEHGPVTAFEIHSGWWIDSIKVRYGQTWSPIRGRVGGYHVSNYELSDGFIEGIFVTFHKDYDFGTGPYSSPYVFSFQFQDSNGIQSPTYGADHGLGLYSMDYSHPGCRLSYISGTSIDHYVESFKPYFECPTT